MLYLPRRTNCISLRAITHRYLFAMLGSAIATGIACLSVWLSLAVHLALYAVNARSERLTDAL